MAKKDLSTSRAFRKAALTLKSAQRVAEERGSAEELANIALTWMELAVRIAKEEESKEDKKEKKMGFHHHE